MALRIEIIVNNQAAMRTMEMLQVRLASLEVPLLAAGLAWSDHMAFNFVSNPWPPLKASTIIRKARGGFPPDPLVRTGALTGAATGGEWSAGRKGAGNFQARLGLPGYAGFHFDGTRFMPARNFAFVGIGSLYGKIRTIFEEWLAVE